MSATPFRITDRVPVGHVALEASAGTGKTWSIVGLATRALAEGRCTADGLLVVTFARSATRELRSRLLERLDEAVGAMDAALRDGPAGIAALAGGADGVLAALATTDPPVAGGQRTPLGGPEDLQTRRDRLADALAEIDMATVTTIHGFAAEALTRLGDVGRGTLLEDEQAFAADIAGDLRLRIAHQQPEAVRFLPFVDHAAELARAGLVTDPRDVLPGPGLGHLDAAKAWMVTEAHAEGVRRKRRGRVHTHDDLLRRLADRLQDRDHGADAALRVGGRYRLGLVDEFQDTDPVQWRILERLFTDPTGADGRCLVLVGDPKQAIYAFRGADVHAYVAARGTAVAQHLDTNRRSDRAVVDAVLALFTGQSMGQGIDVPAVAAAHGDRLQGLGTAPVVLSVVPDDAPVRRTAKGHMQVGGLRDAVARDVARQVVGVLQAGARITSPSGAHSTSPPGAHLPSPPGAAARDVGPPDIAVLVRTRQQASMVQGHLITAGVPSVVNGVGNVLASPAARDWMHVLRALDRPSQGGLARLAALTDLVGWTTAQVAAADDEARDALHVTLHDWRHVLRSTGVAATFRRMAAATGLAARLLARPDGNRKLTDLEHVAELLHSHGTTHVVGTAGLLAWLEAGAAEAAASSRLVPPDHLASRLERGGDAVQILTVHGAKGLEFGIVMAPFLWDVVGRAPIVKTFHDPTTGRRRVWVGRGRDADAQHMDAISAQERDHEERRLAYVAATRARHHLRLWWAPADRASESPLGTLLARPALVRTTAEARRAAAAMQQRHPGLLEITESDLGAPVPTFAATADSGPAPVLARLGRAIDAGWRRTSYSKLVGDAHAAGDEAGSGGETRDVQAPTGTAEDEARSDAGVDAEGDPVEVGVVVPDPDLDAVVPLGPMRGGADVGTTLHSVLEHVDFDAEDLPRTVRGHLARQVQRHAVDLGDENALDVIADGLAAALETPLRPGGPALVDVPRSSRLDEMAFELPVLAEGLDTQQGRVLVTDIADLLDAHLPGDDPLVGYGRHLRQGLADVEIRGFLAGFIDLLCRVPGEDAYVVADYKTNRMAPAGTEDVTVGHFTAATMAAEMVAHHYPLQALVYLVAAHRYLRWRIPGYDPDTHLAGAAYLFLRGMTGPDTPVRDGMVCGVFRWRPPTGLLLALDALLATGMDPADRDRQVGGR